MFADPRWNKGVSVSAGRCQCAERARRMKAGCATAIWWSHIYHATKGVVKCEIPVVNSSVLEHEQLPDRNSHLLTSSMNIPNFTKKFKYNYCYETSYGNTCIQVTINWVKLHTYITPTVYYLWALNVIVEIVSEGVNEVDGLVSWSGILKMTRKENYNEAEDGRGGRERERDRA